MELAWASDILMECLIKFIEIILQCSHAPWKTWKMTKYISRPRKVLTKEKARMSWKNPGNSLRIHAELKLSIFLDDLYPPKAFSPTNYCPGKS